ncbi:L-allo-threonine aldolase, partial [Globisporangium splendens]
MVSDTVTRPSDAMRRAIAAAPVGDDVYSTDPSVNELQQFAAQLLGKQAALYVPSGTMSNLIALGAHCRRGDEIIVGDKAHIFMYEGAGASAYMGVGLHTIKNQPDGTMKIADIQDAVRADDPHYPRTRLVALENTHNTCGGRVLPMDFIHQVEEFCQDAKLKLHIDGARLANASVASGIPMADLVAGADSVSLCLSKGLGAPVGSILAGTEEFIYNAKRLRKSLGGGMRQAGVIAAAGKFALEHQLERLADDHTNAKALAHGLTLNSLGFIVVCLVMMQSQIPGIDVNEDDVDTNIVFFHITPDAKLDAATLVQRLDSEKGILVGGGYWNGQKVRAVTNLHISAQDIAYTVASVRDLMT